MSGGCQEDGGKENIGAFVISCCDTPKVLEPAEHTLDELSFWGRSSRLLCGGGTAVFPSHASFRPSMLVGTRATEQVVNFIQTHLQHLQYPQMI
jgi:hypothetical protein